MNLIKNFMERCIEWLRQVSTGTTASQIPVYKLESDWKISEQLIAPRLSATGIRLLASIEFELQQLREKNPGLVAKIYYGHNERDAAGKEGLSRVWVYAEQLCCGILVSRRAKRAERCYQEEHELAHILTMVQGQPLSIGDNKLFMWISTFADHPSVELAVQKCGGDHLPYMRQQLKLTLRQGWHETADLSDPVMLGCGMFDLCRPFPEFRESALQAVKSVNPLAAQAFDCMWSRYEETKNEILNPDGVSKFIALCSKDLHCSDKVGLVTVEQLVNGIMKRPNGVWWLSGS